MEAAISANLFTKVLTEESNLSPNEKVEGQIEIFVDAG
jgi:hypothetical protein